LRAAPRQRRAAKRARQAGNPHYLPVEDDLDGVDDIPIVKLDLDDSPKDTRPGHRLLSRTASPRPSGSSREEEPRTEYQIDREGEMPDGSKAEPSQRSTARDTKRTGNGLKQVDLAEDTTTEYLHPASSGRAAYDDYDVDDSTRPVEEPAQSTPVEVVQVVTKKKKKKTRVAIPGDDE
jgi:hypothetical protein